MTVDPVAKFKRVFAEARKAGLVLPEAMALATSDRRGRPSVRYMLLKSAGKDGFVFYTNLDSRKAREIRENPYASIAFYWDPIGKQARVEGRLSLVGKAEADEYWRTRPRGSQIAAYASKQSAPAQSHAALMRLYRRIEREWEGREIPRPSYWTGYRLRPRRIEFWTRHEPRMHLREEFVRTRDGWRRRILQP